MPTANAAASMRRWCIPRKSRLARLGAGLKAKSCSAASEWRIAHGLPQANRTMGSHRHAGADRVCLVGQYIEEERAESRCQGAGP